MSGLRLTNSAICCLKHWTGFCSFVCLCCPISEMGVIGTDYLLLLFTGIHTTCKDQKTVLYVSWCHCFAALHSAPYFPSAFLDSSSICLMSGFMNTVMGCLAIPIQKQQSKMQEGGLDTCSLLQKLSLDCVPVLGKAPVRLLWLSPGLFGLGEVRHPDVTCPQGFTNPVGFL